MSIILTSGDAIQMIERAQWDENNSALSGADIWGQRGEFAAPRASGFFTYEAAIREAQKLPRLTVRAVGGCTFHVSYDNDFLGSLEFGSLDDDGQYEQDDEEIIEAAKERFDIDASTEGRVL